MAESVKHDVDDVLISKKSIFIRITVTFKVFNAHVDVEAQTLEDLKQQKAFVREQKKQYKELKDLVKKHHKKTTDLIKEHSSRQSELNAEHQRQLSILQKSSRRDGKKR